MAAGKSARQRANASKFTDFSGAQTFAAGMAMAHSAGVPVTAAISHPSLLTFVDLLIATGQNNIAMNKAILQIARQFVDGNGLKEGMLNRVEAGIRAFDPCLSCSTHAVGAMPLRIQLVDARGDLLQELVRPS